MNIHNLKPEETQLISMALAHLAIERPGWQTMTRELAARVDGTDAKLYDRFHALRAAHVKLTGEEDSIVQLRQAVQRQNPLLWVMVQELVWPK